MTEQEKMNWMIVCCASFLEEQRRLFIEGIISGGIRNKYDLFAAMQIIAGYSVAQEENTGTNAFLDRLRKEFSTE